MQLAVDDFVIGMKADGAWAAMNTVVLMAGPRTLAGALVPLKGTAPTQFNFVGSDYVRGTGLKGNGSTKYIDTNLVNNGFDRYDYHTSVYVNGDNTSAGALILAEGSQKSGIEHNGASDWRYYSRSTGGFSLSDVSNGNTANGFAIVTRAPASSLMEYLSPVSTLQSAFRTPNTPTTADPIYLWRQGAGYANARIAFYSLGTDVSDPVAMRTRLNTLMADIAAAVP